MAKRFRKVFIVCQDNLVFNLVPQLTIYKHRDSAEFACRRLQDKAKEEQQKLWNANKPMPKFKVHGFYLVHEDVFRD